MILVRFPNNWIKHRTWIANQLFGRYDIPFKLQPENRTDWVVCLEGIAGSISMPDSYFSGLSFDYKMYPMDPAPWVTCSVNEIDFNLPVLFGSIEQIWAPVITCGENIQIDSDIFGSAYWLMARMEEYEPNNLLDDRDRFSAFQSHAWRNNYLMIPIIDEWMRLLIEVAKRIWPNANFKELNRFSQFLTHDVDDPYMHKFMPLVGAAKLIAANAIKAKSIGFGIKLGANYGLSKLGIAVHDPCDTYDWLMNLSDGVGAKSAFFFMATDCSCQLDARYDVSDPVVGKLLKKIHARGHEIGIHPGYLTFRNGRLLIDQTVRLKEALLSAGVVQNEIGSRMHYLRWDIRETPSHLSAAGISYDTTLGYADHPGFRCGTCHPYKFFDKNIGDATELLIRPLIAMECTVQSRRYMNLGATEEAYNVLTALKHSCKKVNGEFVLLWHNSFLFNGQERDLYSSIIRN